MSSNILEFGDASKNNKSMLFYLNKIENSVTNDVSNLKIFSNPLNELSFNIDEGLFKTKNIDLSDNLNVYGNVILEGSKISTDNSNIFLPISFNNYSYKLSEELNSKIVENMMTEYEDISDSGYKVDILPKSNKSNILVNVNLNYRVSQVAGQNLSIKLMRKNISSSDISEIAIDTSYAINKAIQLNNIYSNTFLDKNLPETSDISGLSYYIKFFIDGEVLNVDTSAGIIGFDLSGYNSFSTQELYIGNTDSSDINIYNKLNSKPQQFLPKLDNKEDASFGSVEVDNSLNIKNLIVNDVSFLKPVSIDVSLLGLKLDGNLIPTITDTFSLGNETNIFNDIHINSNTLVVGTSRLSITKGQPEIFDNDSTEDRLLKFDRYDDMSNGLIEISDNLIMKNGTIIIKNNMDISNIDVSYANINIFSSNKINVLNSLTVDSLNTSDNTTININNELKKSLADTSINTIKLTTKNIENGIILESSNILIKQQLDVSNVTSENIINLTNLESKNTAKINEIIINNDKVLDISNTISKIDDLSVNTLTTTNELVSTIVNANEISLNNLYINGSNNDSNNNVDLSMIIQGNIIVENNQNDISINKINKLTKILNNNNDGSIIIDPKNYGTNDGSLNIYANLNVNGNITSINSTVKDISSKTIIFDNTSDIMGIEISGNNETAFLKYVKNDTNDTNKWVTDISIDVTDISVANNFTTYDVSITTLEADISGKSKGIQNMNITEIQEDPNNLLITINNVYNTFTKYIDICNVNFGNPEYIDSSLSLNYNTDISKVILQLTPVNELDILNTISGGNNVNYSSDLRDLSTNLDYSKDKIKAFSDLSLQDINDGLLIDSIANTSNYLVSKSGLDTYLKENYIPSSGNSSNNVATGFDTVNININNYSNTLTYNENVNISEKDIIVNAENYFKNNGKYYLNVENNNTRFLVGSDNQIGLTGDVSDDLLFGSKDGKDFEQCDIALQNSIDKIAYNGYYFIALSKHDTTHNAALSYNGIDWSGVIIDSSCNDIIWDKELKKWIVCSSTKLHESYNGYDWINKFTSTDTLLSLKKYDNKYYVGGTSSLHKVDINNYSDNSNQIFNDVSLIEVSKDNILLYSNNTIYKNDLSNNDNDVIFNNINLKTLSSNGKIYVAGGKMKSDLSINQLPIIYSNDGLKWNYANGTKGDSNLYNKNNNYRAQLNECNDIIWDGNMFVAVGKNNYNSQEITIKNMYSYDGKSWFINKQNNFNVNDYDISTNFLTIAEKKSENNTIEFSKEKTLFVDVSGYLYNSYNINSSNLKLDPSYGKLDLEPKTSVFSGNKWIVSGKHDSSYNYFYSSDGNSWSNNIIDTSNILSEFNVVKYNVKDNNGMYIAGGKSTTDNSGLFYSYDGITYINSSNSLADVSKLVCNKNVLVAFNNNNIKYSEDNGKVWKYSLNSENIINIESDYNMFVGITDSSFIYSFNGNDWVFKSGNQNESLLNIYYCNNYWVLFTTTCVKYSKDGINWIKGKIDEIPVTCNLIYNNNDVWFANCNNKLFFSEDGIKWKLSLSNKDIRAIACTDKKYNLEIQHPLLIGNKDNNQNSLFYTINGTEYNKIGNNKLNKVYDIHWGGNLWVAVGNNNDTSANLIYSENMINWYDGSINFGTDSINDNAKLCCYNNKWILTYKKTDSNNRLFYSLDGKSWDNSLNIDTPLNFSANGNYNTINKILYNEILDKFVLFGKSHVTYNYMFVATYDIDTNNLEIKHSGNNSHSNSNNNNKSLLNQQDNSDYRFYINDVIEVGNYYLLATNKSTWLLNNQLKTNDYKKLSSESDSNNILSLDTDGYIILRSNETESKFQYYEINSTNTHWNDASINIIGDSSINNLIFNGKYWLASNESQNASSLYHSLDGKHWYNLSSQNDNIRDLSNTISQPTCLSINRKIGMNIKDSKIFLNKNLVSKNANLKVNSEEIIDNNLSLSLKPNTLTKEYYPQFNNFDQLIVYTDSDTYYDASWVAPTAFVKTDTSYINLDISQVSSNISNGSNMTISSEIVYQTSYNNFILTAKRLFNVSATSAATEHVAAGPPGLLEQKYTGNHNDVRTWFTANPDAKSGSSSVVHTILKPGGEGEHFSYNWTGTFIPHVSGTWQFWTLSHKSSNIWIDDLETGATTTVVDNPNDGSGAVKRSGSISVTADKVYGIQVAFEADTGGSYMRMDYHPPGEQNRTYGTDDDSLTKYGNVFMSEYQIPPTPPPPTSWIWPASYSGGTITATEWKVFTQTEVDALTSNSVPGYVIVAGANPVPATYQNDTDALNGNPWYILANALDSTFHQSYGYIGLQVDMRANYGISGNGIDLVFELPANTWTSGFRQSGVISIWKGSAPHGNSSIKDIEVYTSNTPPSTGVVPSYTQLTVTNPDHTDNTTGWLGVGGITNWSDVGDNFPLNGTEDRTTTWTPVQSKYVIIRIKSLIEPAKSGFSFHFMQLKLGQN